jgi:hypothetical protein
MDGTPSCPISQDCPTNQDLATGIAFAFCLARAGDQPALRDAQASEPFVERLNACADAFGLRHRHLR